MSTDQTLLLLLHFKKEKKMKKRVMTIALTAIMALSMSSTAFAASWQKNDTGNSIFSLIFFI